MQVKVLSPQEIYLEIANLIVNQIDAKPNTILGLPTGSSPMGVYDLLVRASEEKKVSFREVQTFNLDEYYPIEDTNPQSFRWFMNKNLFDGVKINKTHTHFPSISNYKEYDKQIADAGGIDIQILGLGSNGHIAFNEPGTSFDSLTHVTDLAQSTIKDNSRFFDDNSSLVPTQAISMGLKSIMNAKKIILIATGKSKAKAIKQLIEEDKNINLPASILKDHPDVTIYIDQDAASLLC